MPTITVIDGANTSQTINTLPPVGAAAKAAALPVTVATDDPLVISSANTATQTANVATYLAAINVSTGAVNDTAYANTAGSANGTHTSLLKGLYVAISSVVARLPVIGTQSSANSLSVTPAQEQDPIYDHANGVKITANTTSQVLYTPSSTTRFARISCDVDIFINTANTAAADNGTAIHIIANAPEIVPVTPSVAIKGISANTASVVRICPMKTRP